MSAWSWLCGTRSLFPVIFFWEVSVWALEMVRSHLTHVAFLILFSSFLVHVYEGQKCHWGFWKYTGGCGIWKWRKGNTWIICRWFNYFLHWMRHKSYVSICISAQSKRTVNTLGGIPQHPSEKEPTTSVQPFCWPWCELEEVWIHSSCAGKSCLWCSVGRFMNLCPCAWRCSMTNWGSPGAACFQCNSLCRWKCKVLVISLAHCCSKWGVMLSNCS